MKLVRIIDEVRRFFREHWIRRTIAYGVLFVLCWWLMYWFFGVIVGGMK